MKRVLAWLIPMLLVLLILGGLLYLRGRAPEPQVSIGQPQAVEEARRPRGFAKPKEPSEEDKAKTNSSALAAALDSGNISDCEKIIYDDVLKQQCYDNLNYASALKSGDEEHCLQLIDESLKSQCLNRSHYESAISLSDDRLCEKISDEALKNLCLDQVSALLADEADSADACSGISSDIVRTNCEDNFYMEDSVKNLDADGCGNLSADYLREQCQTTVIQNLKVIEESKKAAQEAQISRTPQEVLALCDSLSGLRSESCKNSIYPELAFDEKDLSYCDKISDPILIEECKKEQGDRIDQYYMRQASNSGDLSACDSIQNAELKALCLSL
ncbi:MAG: hypothetical protein OEY44_02720 [Candidatus Peregrinibacteria bacterium]|nr:hypothetical protein [Candidatus Peregrinibacteria bacterium]